MATDAEDDCGGNKCLERVGEKREYGAELYVKGIWRGWIDDDEFRRRTEEHGGGDEREKRGVATGVA